MMILGLTGSIAMGKTTTARMFAAAGVPVFAADGAVHALYRGRARPLVEAVFPGVAGPDGIDRRKLAAALGNDAAAWQRLEAIVHPLVREAETAFLSEARNANRRLVVLDHPLLLESADRHGVDAVVVVTAPAAVQRARAFERPGMTEALFQAILARQLSDAEKRARAHFIIDTSHGLDAAERAVHDILRAVAGPAAGS